MLLWSALCLCLTQCQPKKTSTPHIFKYNQANGISSLDPAFSKDQATMWACNQLFDGLVRLDNRLNIQPAIADSWDISSDGLVYTFYLKQDVYFHQDPCFAPLGSRKVTAHDFVYSMNRILDTAVASPGAWIFNDRVHPSQAFNATDSFTLVIRLQKPFGPFLQILSMMYTCVVPREAIDYYKAEFRVHPVGTGPFIFKRWEDGIGLFLARNPRYFMKDTQGQSLPYLQGVKISFIEQKKIEYLSFMNHNLDLLNGIDISYINELIDPDGALKPVWEHKIRLLKAPYLNTEYLGILQSSDKSAIHPLLLNKKIRQAINYGINKKELVTYLKNNIGIPANSGFVPKGLYSYDPTKVPGYTYDPDKARQLIQASGMDPNKLPPIVIHINSANQDLAEFVAKQLEIIGLRIELELHPSEFLGQIVKEGKADFFRRSWIADYADPESYLTCFYSKNSSPPNYTRFAHKEYDQLYELSIVTTDDQKRKEYYQAMDKILIEEAPIVPLFYDEVVRFVHRNIDGIEPNSINLLDLRYIKKND